MTLPVGTHARVLKTEALSPNVVRIHLQTPRGWSANVGDKIKVHVGGAAMRSYTPSFVDSTNQTMAMVVHVHRQDTAGCRWVRGLRPDDSVSFFGPARSLPSPTGRERWAAFYGDETTIGVAEAIRAALPSECSFVGAIEVAAEDVAALEHLELEAAVRREHYGDALVEHLGMLSIPQDGVIWLSGEASSVLSLRRALEQRGVSREQLRIKPYWSVKGKAHRKKLERTLLR